MRKFSVIFAVSFVSVLVLFSACTKKKQENFVLKIGYGGGLCEAPLHMAYELGYFKEEGLEVELIKIAAGSNAFDLITAGSIDACFALLASIIQPLANGLPAKITSGLHTGCDVTLVKADSGITKPEHLRGKKVGIPSMTSSPTIYTKRVLADYGVDIRMESSEVEFIVYNSTDLPIILANGGVDAIALAEPTASIAAIEYGYVALLDSAIDEPYKDQYCCTAYVSDRLLEQHRDIAEKYTRAMQKASAYIQGHQEEITRIQNEKNYIPGDPVTNAEVLKKFNYIPSVSGAYKQFGIIAPQLQEVGMLSTDVNVEALRENSFVYFEGLDARYK
jgi:NitT/TauT family transport system substrate-binding protein